MQHSLADIVETVKNAKANNRGVTLLIGAGCSVDAGIPLANDFVKLIAEKFPSAYSHAEEKTYPHCMARLSHGERQDLIGDYIDKAKINWAHIGIAQLVNFGYVDRILTTNFDPLVVRACAMIGEFPAVYDLASSEAFRPSVIPEKAVLYLHGQRSGFKILNTPEECLSLEKRLEPIFSEMSRGRTWIVVGYSGDNDPVFTQLALIQQFDHRLYWVGHKDSEPSKRLRDDLLNDSRYAFYINGFDADGFFVSLAQELGCFPPAFISTPFSHLKGMMELVNPYSIPGQESLLNDEALDLIKRAVKRFEVDEKSKEMEANSLLVAGDYEKLVQLIPVPGEDLSPQLQNSVSWGYVMQGNTLGKQAVAKPAAQAGPLFAKAYEKYASALKIKPDQHSAFTNWGYFLDQQARSKSGREAERLFTKTYEKYDAALKIKSNLYQTLVNWGHALGEQAKTKPKSKARPLFEQAYMKYDAALKIKPDDYAAVFGWGYYLEQNAEKIGGEEADPLYLKAYEKYKMALEINPGSYEVLNNWANALSGQAKVKSGAKANTLFLDAYIKYQAAFEAKPDEAMIFINWILSVRDHILAKTGKKGAIALKGTISKIETIAKETVQGLYELACVFALSKNLGKAKEYLLLAAENNTLPPVGILETDKDINALRDSIWFKELIEKLSL